MTPDRVPFCWQDKRVLRRIREKCPDPGSALAVYHALTEAASNNEAEEFTTTHDHLANLCGFCARTVRSRIPDLVAVGVIEVSTPRLKAPSTFRLLPSGNGCPTSGNGCRAFGKGVDMSVADIRRTEQQKGRERERARGKESNQAEPATPTALTPPRNDPDAPTAEPEAKEPHPDAQCELPRGFPKTEQEALAAGSLAGCTPEQAAKFWHDAAQTDGRNMFGQPIKNYRAYLASRLAAERSRKAERAARPAYGKPARIVPDHSDPNAWNLDKIKKGKS